MTTYEQELTLFGGWAKAQIPPQIELGAEKTSGMPSVLIYIRSEWEWEEVNSFENLGKLIISPYIKMATEKEPVSISIGYAHFDFENRMESITTLDPSRLYEQRDGYTGLVPTKWLHIFAETWIHQAFTRFFEIWEKGTNDDLRRGAGAKHKLQKSFAGMVGSQNDVGGTSKKGTITKLPSGEWYLKDRANLYPRIRRLPESGIASARKHARELQARRKTQVRKK